MLAASYEVVVHGFRNVHIRRRLFHLVLNESLSPYLGDDDLNYTECQLARSALDMDGDELVGWDQI
jgi:hypothetical protein